MIRVKVGKETARMLRLGHPWVIADRYTAAWPKTLRAGDLARLEDEKGEGLGTVLLDPGERVVARLLDRGECRLSGDWLADRLQQAARLRERWIDPEQTTAFRLVNGEGDLVPGLTVDHYGDYLLLQTYSDAWKPHLQLLAKSLESLFRPRGIIHKRRPQQTRDLAAIKDDGPYGRVLSGEAPPARLTVIENGIRFDVDLQSGLHSGLFLDQRANRAWLQQQSTGVRFLNLFAYTGAFSVAAALGGAQQTTSVDLSQPYLDRAQENFGLNRLNPKRHRFLAGDCGAVLDRLLAGDERFGMILLDPPSFSTHKKGRFSARGQTAGMVQKTLRLLENGGLLLASCNLQKLTPSDYLKELRGGAQQAGCSLQIMKQLGQGVDFPYHAGFPEGDYLKFFVCRKIE